MRGRIMALAVLTLLCGASPADDGRKQPGHVGTLEDIYGDTGNTFQAAIGFVNFEGTPASQAQQSYGLAVDDMVVKWREFTLAPDVTNCQSTGACATVELGTTNTFFSVGVLRISVLDPSPDPINDCDLDGTADATNDCNGNGTEDVVVKATSAAEVDGEIAVLDRIANPGGYSGSLPISSLGDTEGVLFIAQVGAELPTVTVTYLDNDDGTGIPCPNDVDPAKHGLVQAFDTVFIGATCEVRIVDAVISDNGDADDFPDTNETVAMQLSLVNGCGVDLHNCTGRLFSNSPEVDCILDSSIDIGDLPDDPQPVLTEESFVWKLADVQRGSVEDSLFAEFSLTVACDEIVGLSVPQTVSLPLDLDLENFGQTPIAWTEGFETGTLGKFEPENLDAGIPGANNTEGHINGDGTRCQYSDPDWPNSNSYGNSIALDCFPGATLPGANAIYWQVDGAGTGGPDGGRAKSGSFSMYYGMYLSAESDFTTPLAIIESVRTTDPINLGVGAPELSFWHQISLMDYRFLSPPPNRSVDRGVVEYKLVDSSGDDVSTWMRLEPFQNSYDSQNWDFFFNCMFDPIDDGTTEDDFFDPSDPERRLGPSSTCHPEFTYSCIGDTDEPFQIDNICNGGTPPQPGDQGDLGGGTWLQTKVNLQEIRGQRIKLRYLVAGIKASAETHEGQFSDVNPGPWDDGWWIDDVTIDETLVSAAELLIDEGELRHCAGDDTVGCLEVADCSAAGVAGPCEGEPPQCGPICTAVTVVVATAPDATGGPLDEALSVPGQPIELDASGSSGQCLDGVLQYRFTIDGGAELRSWSENPLLVDAPQQATDYRVEVRCSSDAGCMGSALVEVDVECPTTGSLALPFPETITAPDASSFSWSAPLSYDLFSGDLGEVGSYAGTLVAGFGNSFPATDDPLGGEGLYYVIRAAGEFCNDTGLWTTEGLGESPLREQTLP